MAWLAVDKDGSEQIYDFEPIRDLQVDRWDSATDNSWWIELPKGTIEKIVGRKLSWQDIPVEIQVVYKVRQVWQNLLIDTLGSRK